MSIEPDHPVEKLLILQLTKDGSYKLIELEVQNELAEAYIALHQALKKKKRTRKDEKMIKTKLGNSTLIGSTEELCADYSCIRFRRTTTQSEEVNAAGLNDAKFRE